MSDFEDKLQSILGNPEAMDQILAVARSIGGSQSGGGPEPDQSGGGSEPAQAAVEEETLPAGGETPDLGSILGSLDPRLLQVGMRLLSEYNAPDERKTALLAALRPFVRKERQAKVDKAIQIAKLAHVIRVALDAFQRPDS